MSRNTIAAAIVLAMLTGIVIGQLTARESQGVEPRLHPAEYRVELVQSFYDGMNRYLEDENTEFLSLLAPGFRDMHAPATETGSAESLIAQLDTLRASAVSPRFEIEEINDLGQTIQVRLSNGLPVQLSAAGFSIEGFATDSVLEFLHVDGNAIVSRWGQDDRIARIDATLSGTSQTGLPMAVAIESKLITLGPGAEWSPNLVASDWLIVEEGSIVLESSAGIERLNSGDARLAPHGIRRIANRADEASSVWITLVDRLNSVNVYYAGNIVPPRVTIEEWVWSNLVDLPTDLDGIHIDVAKVFVPPSVNLEPDSDALGHHLIVIDGAVTATVHHGDLLHVTSGSLAISEREGASLSAGQAAAPRAGASVSYRTNTPTGATLLLVTITLPE